jgi:hypothetical protein
MVDLGFEVGSAGLKSLKIDLVLQDKLNHFTTGVR